MKRHVMLVAAVTIGLSACGEGSSPTGAGRDLLNNNGSTPPTLSESKYGQVLAEGDTVVAIGPFTASRDSLPGYVHIEDRHNSTSYKPPGYEHIDRVAGQTDGANVTQYKPVGYGDHISKAEADLERLPDDHVTKYRPRGYKHIRKGENESYYRKVW